VTIQVRVTPQEAAAWRKAAGERTVADWVREVCARATKTT
jgi:hypothetical protein